MKGQFATVVLRFFCFEESNVWDLSDSPGPLNAKTL